MNARIAERDLEILSGIPAIVLCVGLIFWDRLTFTGGRCLAICSYTPSLSGRDPGSRADSTICFSVDLE